MYISKTHALVHVDLAGRDEDYQEALKFVSPTNTATCTQYFQYLVKYASNVTGSYNMDS